MNALLEKKDRILFTILTLYFFIMVYGNLFKFSKIEASTGLSTVLILLIILLKFNVIFKEMLQKPVFKVIALVFFWCMVTSLFSAEGVLRAYTRLIMLSGYLFAAVAVYRMYLPEERVRFLIYTLGVSIFIASFLTIIDYLKIYNVPYVNEAGITTKIGGERVEQAGGFFPRRSAMAAYYSIIIATLMYYALKTKNIKVKMLLLVSSGISFIALFLTHNRSGILSVIMAMAIYLFMDKTVKMTKKIRIIILSVIVFSILIVIIYFYLPGHIDVYIMKLNRYLPGGGFGAAVAITDSVVQSDESRLYFFLSIMESLLTNPLGNGFSLVYTEKYGFKSPHNIISYLIWAMGIMAFILIPMLGYYIYRSLSLKKLLNKKNEDSEIVVCIVALQVGMLSWLINNMAHNSLSTGLAWLYLGIALNLLNRFKRENDPLNIGKIEKEVADINLKRCLHLKN